MDTSQPSAEMSIPEILRGLTLYTGRFPEEAVQAALSEREAITPHLLQELRAVAAAPAEYAQRKDYMLPIFTAFLLAQFREQRAYQPLLEILTAPGNTAYDLFGDTLNESMKNILGSVYDGDPVPLRAIVEDEGLDEFVRGTALATFPVLLNSGRMSREDVLAYYKSLFRGALPREPNQVWNELACLVADLLAVELIDDLRQAYADDLVDPGYATLNELLNDMEREPVQPPPQSRKVYDLIDDVVSEMSWWAAFDPEETPRHEQSSGRLYSSVHSPTDPAGSDHEPIEHSEVVHTRSERSQPKLGRNEPCLCGSGKKYKKCCLAKYEEAARLKATADTLGMELAYEAEETAKLAEQESALRELEERRDAAMALDREMVVGVESALTTELPALSVEDQQLLDDWWDLVGPVYASDDNQENCDWLLERTLEFLDQQPKLFRYLELEEDFLFELEDALTRAGRRADYLALLRRLRREQPDAYSVSFGCNDHDLIAQALITRQRHEIRAYLTLFLAYPLDHVRDMARVVDLLAWCGCETELRELLDGTTHAIADAPDVLGGEFAQAWLTRLVMAPFLEAGDDSPQALEQLCRAVTEAGYVKGEEPESQEWLRRAVRLASRSPAEAGLDLKNSKDRWLQHDAGWNFAGWLRRTRGLGWASACFLANALLGYWGWDDGKRNKGGAPFGLSVPRLNHYIARCCQDSLGPSGVLAFSTLQAFHYFTEYLAVHGYFSDDDARRLQSVASRCFETVRGQLDLADPGYALCPTYAALVAADHDQSGGVNPKSILG